MSGSADHLLSLAEAERARLRTPLHDQLVERLYEEAGRIAARALDRSGEARRFQFDLLLDRILTSRILGLPAMAALFGGAFWLTIAGANIPSALLTSLLVDHGAALLHRAADAVHAPAWLQGLGIDGVYLAVAWVVSVMLPPMAIFFPIFTLLEDFGYLPRVAFNLDRTFRWAGAHGKQSLTMMMGYGCNAAGVVAARIIDSPRERLIAILTNNFSICNGRWPTLILISTIFVGASAPPAAASLAAALTVVTVAVLGIVVTLLVSAFLSRTLLRGTPSVFSLELPPYRPPRVWQTIYTSVIDRTLIVLWRAVQMAAPAGAVIWLISNVEVAHRSLAHWMALGLDPIGALIGLNGIILLAYVVAIPANEIVIPTILMLTLNAARSKLAQKGVMLELDDTATRHVLIHYGGWTLLTGVNLMLFSLLHNPCSTTIMTIWRETRSRKWTWLATLLPLALGFGVCFLTATAARTFGWAPR
ncbi:MAG: ferrous iron transporter B [Chthonomonadales bacterium]|nr:ferrous iron transporter B [Chthonomonadales bacterium]